MLPNSNRIAISQCRRLDDISFPEKRFGSMRCCTVAKIDPGFAAKVEEMRASIVKGAVAREAENG